jgi:hypothetical protein
VSSGSLSSCFGTAISQCLKELEFLLEKQELRRLLRGELGETDLEQARAIGLTDGDIIETVANVALNIFTNYVNHIAGTIIDFPEVKPGNPTCDCA